MPRRLRVQDVNLHVMCMICDGYLIDATTIIECLHAFCRTCIVRYLENNNFCPVCDVQVHKTNPLSSIRSDQTLQDLVYKVVPGLYQDEMQKRREFFAEHPEAVVGSDPEERGEGEPRFFSSKESISLSLHHRPKDSKLEESSEEKDPTTRHLSCPAAFTIGHLKKFIHLKFSLPSTYAVDVYYDEEPLRDSFTLMDVAYIYSWKRAEPMKFFYSISKRVPKIIEPTVSVALPPPPAPEMEIDSNSSAPVENTSENHPTPETEEVEQMHIDVEPLKPGDDNNIDDTLLPPPPAPTILPPSPPTSEEAQAISVENVSDAVVSSSEDVQPMDTTPEPEIAKSTNSSLPPTNSVIMTPLVIPEPVYNTVKLVSTPESDTMLSPTNGFRLKFIHDPQLISKPRLKKSGRKGGRSSRQKNVPVRLARLAPYPPPPPPPPPQPQPCLTTQPLQHLSQLTVGKLVPSVITTLAPTFVTTLVSTTSNSLCNATNDSIVPQVSSLISQPSQAVSSSISTHSNGNVTPIPNTCADTGISVSSSTIASILAVSSSPTVVISNTATASQDSQNSTKELPSTVTASESISINQLNVPVSVTTSLVQSIVKDTSVSNVLNTSLSTPITVSSSSSLTNSNNILSDINTSHNKSSNGDLPASTVSLPCSKESISSDGVSLTVTNTKLPVSTNNTDSNIQINSISVKKQNSLEPMMNGNETNQQNHHQPYFENSDRKSESFKMSVKNSISAEFSDNDDLGCQADLVVDEQKMDSSDNEDDTDAALRKKINAIAEKEDEADITDDTEADSGRASDMSCPARCEEEVGSPATTETVTSTVSVPASVTTTTATSSAPSDVRHTKSNNINKVIKQLYLQHEIGRPVSSPKPVPTPPNPSSQAATSPKDDNGVLDLSTCIRKPGEVQPTRKSQSVANPVLDIKHRQQTYLPAPVKQHTLCPPAPKHPTSSPLLMHQLTARHSTPSILQAQLTGNVKPSPHPVPYSSPNIPYPLSISRSVSSPSSMPVRPCQPTFSYRLSQNAAHQPGMNMFSGMLPFPMMDMTTYTVRSGMVPGMPVAGARSVSTSKESPNTAKMPVFSKQNSPNLTRRTSDSFNSSVPSAAVGHCRIPTLPSPTSTPTHPRTSPSILSRMSPHHRSASPAPSPQNVSIANSLSVSSLTSISTTTTTTSSPQNTKPSVPIYKKSESSSSYKGFKVKRNANLAVFNPDPNGYRQKLVIKNLDSKPNSHH